MSILSVVQLSVSAFIMPYTGWRERLEGGIAPFFPGIRYVGDNSIESAKIMAKLQKGYHEVFAREGWNIRRKYLQNHPGEARKQTCAILINECISFTVGGVMTYRVCHHVWKIKVIENTRLGALISLVGGFLAAAKCFKIMEKGLAICLEQTERFKKWRELDYDINSDRIIETYNAEDDVLSQFICNSSHERITHATYDKKGVVFELSELRKFSEKQGDKAEVFPNEVRECYLTTILIHQRVKFLYKKALASHTLSNATKNEAEFASKIEDAEGIMQEAFEAGENGDYRWMIDDLRPKISLIESKNETRETLKTYEELKEEPDWDKDWKGILSKRFQRLFYVYPNRAPNSSAK